MTERPHIVVLHRWQDRYADYESYVDHRAAAVTYVTTTVGVEGVPGGASGVALVSATDDLAQAREAVDALAARHGEPTRIVALKEDDLLIAAQLRAERGVPGPTVADLLPFRDKLVMARTAAGAGIAQPAFAPVTDRSSVAAFAAEHGWPVVVKPRLGSASAGVSQVDGTAGLDALALDDGQLVQAFDPGAVYHVDGVFDGEDVGPWRASRYLNTCLGFRHGDVLGSVEEDDGRVNRAIGAFTRRVLRGMARFAMAFHLEVFVDVAPDGEVACRFLEIGARVGGAEIAFLWREVHGYDLMEASFRMGLGQSSPPGAVAGGEATGWLLVPAPTERPCRIVAATSMLDAPDGPYAEFILEPGDVLPPADAYYEHVGGRFRFRGATTTEVEAKIRATAKAFEVRGVRVDREEDPAEIRVSTPEDLTYGQLSVWRDVRHHGRARWHEANISAVWPLPGGPDAAAAERAVRALAARHGALRTRYDLADAEKPRQILHPEIGAADVAVLAEPAESASEIAAALAGEAFDLGRQFPWRARIIVRGGRAVEVAFANHHIAADGWAHGVLRRDLVAALADPVGFAAAGEGPGLAGLAADQRGTLAEQRNQRAGGAWRRFYDEVRAPAFLRALGARRPDDGEAEAVQADLGSAAARAGAAELGRRLAVPDSTVLLAAYAAAVARVHELPFVPLKVMSSNRFHPRHHDIVASLNQWSPLVVDAPLDGDLAALAREVHVLSLNAYRFGSFDPDLPSGPRSLALAETPYDDTVWAFNFVDARTSGQALPPAPADRPSWNELPRAIGPRYYLRAYEAEGGTWGLRYRARAAEREDVAGVLRAIGELLAGAAA